MYKVPCHVFGMIETMLTKKKFKDFFRVLLKTHFENLKRRFFSETRQQKRSLAALNEYFANAKGIPSGQVSGKKIASKLKQGFLDVPFNKNVAAL